MCYMNMYDTDVTMTDRAMVLWYNPSLQCPKLASTIISDRPNRPLEHRCLSVDSIISEL